MDSWRATAVSRCPPSSGRGRATPRATRRTTWWTRPPPSGSYRAPAVPADRPNGDDQVFAAAELVRLGVATRVTLVNATVDEALPEAWEIKGTPVGLVRLAASRSRLTAGPR